MDSVLVPELISVTFLLLQWVESAHACVRMILSRAVDANPLLLSSRLSPAVQYVFLLYHQCFLFHWIDLTSINIYSDISLDF